MSVLVSARRGSGLRRLDPTSDLAQVAGLIEEAFAHELDREGRDVLRELRQLSRFGPLFWLLLQVSSEFADVMSGFVWEENGQIVGNTSVNLVGRLPPTWRISNVAVKPGCRGRGIARRLMGAAVEYARDTGAAVVSLQVREDNTIARGLYDSMGFKSVTAETELYLPHPSEARPSSDGQRCRPVEREEWSDIYSLALDSTPKADQHLSPIHKLDYQLDWIQSLSERITALASGRRTFRYVIDANHGLAAYVAIVTARRGSGCHRVSFLVHPRHEGGVETELVGTAIRALRRVRPACAIVKLNPVKRDLLNALVAAGFAPRRTLLTLELDLR